ncbi:hypothetical protein TSAR_007217 [Trichomalopsis sarcophagae]|uniref:Uncharacterized protein n=1 Tax=Trichomalopsis sarcophagae TaxID=543379 RepID=A0A232FLV2_9HYME|nr:hypothetical protein TSAR_007217 [Trichomalopsis sarcophagae]
MLSTRRVKAEWGSNSRESEDSSKNGCKEVEFGVNLNKVSSMLFTKRYKTGPMDGITLNGVNLKLVKDTKYLGVVLDPKLSWDKHIKIKCEKAVYTFWVCKSVFGRTWGL